jgi:hypothetical protein
MNYFQILAHGHDFDVDAFLRSTSLRVGRVWRRNDPKGACAGSSHATSGVEIPLGNGLDIPFRQQESLAAEFLASNREALLTLAQAQGTQHRILGLQLRIELSPTVSGFAVSISPKLSRLALDLGFVPTVYVDLVRVTSVCA